MHTSIKIPVTSSVRGEIVFIRFRIVYGDMNLELTDSASNTFYRYVQFSLPKHDVCYSGLTFLPHLHNVDLSRKIACVLEEPLTYFCKDCVYYNPPIHGNEIHCAVNPSSPKWECEDFEQKKGRKNDC